MAIEILPKGPTRRRGLAYFKNSKFAPGQRTIIAVNGIGEGNDETKEGIEKENVSWPGWGDLKAAAEALNFNIIWTNSSLNDSTDEIDYAIEMAQKDLQAGSIGGVGLSWGGRRWRIWLSRASAAALKKMNAGIVRVASGDCSYNEVTNLISSGVRVPIWLHHSTEDPVVPESASRISMQRFAEAKPDYPIYYTEYGPDGTPENDHNIIGRVTSAGTIPSKFALSKAATGAKYGLTVPTVNIYRWMELNEKNGPTDPATGKMPAAPIPVPPAPQPAEPTATIKAINYAKPTAIQILWTDKPFTYTAPKGDWINNVYDRVINGNRVLTIELGKGGTINFGPTRK